MHRSFLLQEESFDFPGTMIVFNARTGRSLTYKKTDYPSLERLMEDAAVYQSLSVLDFWNDSEDQFQKSLNQRISFKNSPSVINLIILVHQDCNFRCTYCYEDFKHQEMNPIMTSAVIKHIQRRIEEETITHVNLSWFGGEPILGIKAIEEISASIIPLCDNEGITYGSSITTNGYLLTEKNFQRLKKCRVSYYQITLDGLKDIHNQQRVLKNGKGTFDRIISNIEKIVPEMDNETIIIRTNLSRKSMLGIEAFMDFFIEKFGKEKNIYLDFHQVKDLTGNEEPEVETKELLEIVRKFIKKGGNAYPILRKIQPQSTCYATASNTYVITVTGVLHKCTVAIDNNDFSIGRITPDGTFILKENRIVPWINPKLRKDCAECNFLPLCWNNECPLKNQTCNHCHTYKGNEKQLLNLLMLQGHIDYNIRIPS